MVNQISKYTVSETSFSLYRHIKLVADYCYLSRMSHKINKDLRKAFSAQKTANPRVSASPTAEIGDTRLESSVGTPRVGGDDEEIQQNNKN